MSFEEAYLALRRQEGRVYTDEVLAKLPSLPPGHPLFREWTIRRISLVRLMGHLRSLNRPLRILDLGCGNGWMSRHLSYLPGSQVLAADLGDVELAQARRVFAHLPNLQFRRLDIFADAPGRFDIVVMGASVQYFPDLSTLVQRLRSLLLPRGEIHLLDSPFYKDKDIPAARARTEKYYSEAGFPELAAHYHHLRRRDVEALGGMLMYNPNTLFNWLWTRVLRKIDTPFEWWLLPK